MKNFIRITVMSIGLVLFFLGAIAFFISAGVTSVSVVSSGGAPFWWVFLVFASGSSVMVGYTTVRYTILARSENIHASNHLTAVNTDLKQKQESLLAS